MSDLDVVQLARGAGVCFPDCHFLDGNPYEDLLDTLSELRTEEERDDYIRLVKAEDAKRLEKLHALERFAAAILRQAAGQLTAEAKQWDADYCFEVWVGAEKLLTRLEFVALDLEERHRQVVQ